MSLNNLLYSGQPANGKQTPQTVRRVVKRKIDIDPQNNNQDQFLIQTPPTHPIYNQNHMIYQQPSTYQKPLSVISGRTQPNHITPHPQLPQISFPVDDDMLIFSLMAKLLLPKDRIEKINILFQKLLLGKLSFPTVAMYISNNVEICPVIFEVWENLLNRRNRINNSLYKKILEILSQFKANNISMPVLCNFISFISNSNQQSIPYIHLFERIISKFEVLNRFKCPGKILQLALELLSLLPKSSNPLSSTLQPIEKEPTLSSILINEYKEKPFSIFPHYSDISSFLMRNGKPKEHTTHRHTTSRDTIYTPSHHQNLIPMVETQPIIFLNYFTKSLNSGHEGGSRGHDPRHQGMPLPPTRDIHEVLEEPEIREHDMDAILAFDKDTNFIGHIVAVAALSVYDETTWSKIRKLLKSPQVRVYVSERCHSRLPRVMNSHYNACHLCDIFLSTRPINSYLLTLSVPDNIDGIIFPYFNTSLEVSEYLKSVFTLYRSARYKYILFFFRSLYPILSKQHEFMKLILPKSGVMILYYYSKLCEALVPLISKESIEFDTYEAVFDIAYEEVQNRFPDGESLPHRFLSSVLKSIAKNGTILDKMSYEVDDHFGSKSIYVARIASILNHFNSSCKALSVDPKWERMKKFAEAFATNQDQETLNISFPLYREQMLFPSGEMVYLLELNSESDEITVSLISNP